MWHSSNLSKDHLEMLLHIRTKINFELLFVFFMDCLRKQIYGLWLRSGLREKQTKNNPRTSSNTTQKLPDEQLEREKLSILQFTRKYVHCLHNEKHIFSDQYIYNIPVSYLVLLRNEWEKKKGLLPIVPFEKKQNIVAKWNHIQDFTTYARNWVLITIFYMKL